MGQIMLPNAIAATQIGSVRPTPKSICSYPRRIRICPNNTPCTHAVLPPDMLIKTPPAIAPNAPALCTEPNTSFRCCQFGQNHRGKQGLKDIPEKMLPKRKTSCNPNRLGGLRCNESHRSLREQIALCLTPDLALRRLRHHNQRQRTNRQHKGDHIKAGNNPRNADHTASAHPPARVRSRPGPCFHQRHHPFTRPELFLGHHRAESRRIGRPLEACSR